jgi:hypothetical protein
MTLQTLANRASGRRGCQPSRLCLRTIPERHGFSIAFRLGSAIRSRLMLAAGAAGLCAKVACLPAFPAPSNVVTTGGTMLDAKYMNGMVRTFLTYMGYPSRCRPEAPDRFENVTSGIGFSPPKAYKREQNILNLFSQLRRNICVTYIFVQKLRVVRHWVVLWRQNGRTVHESARTLSI